LYKRADYSYNPKSKKWVNGITSDHEREYIMAKYLVTGGAGFIGSHLVDRLVAAAHEVIVLDDCSTGKRHQVNSDATLIHGDITDFALLQHLMKDVEGCFHLAAIASVARSSEDWLGTHAVNLTATIKLFEAARTVRPSNPPRIVYASSAAAYGDNPTVPLSESCQPQPMTAYGADKYGCELHARVGYEVHGISSVGLRFFNVFGPRQDPKSPYSGVISIFAERLQQNLPLSVQGDGEQTRDFIYVEDVVTGLCRAMELQQSGSLVINLCRGEEISINQLAATLASILDKPLTLEHVPPRAGDIRRSVGSPQLLQQVLKFTPAHTVQDGLKRMLSFGNE
jgi:UDP-glucose 4-epimerase